MNAGLGAPIGRFVPAIPAMGLAMAVVGKPFATGGGGVVMGLEIFVAGRPSAIAGVGAFVSKEMGLNGFATKGFVAGGRPCFRSSAWLAAEKMLKLTLISRPLVSCRKASSPTTFHTWAFRVRPPWSVNDWNSNPSSRVGGAVRRMAPKHTSKRVDKEKFFMGT